MATLIYCSLCGYEQDESLPWLREMRELETRIEKLTAALETIRTMTRSRDDDALCRHIATLINMALEEKKGDK